MKSASLLILFTIIFSTFLTPSNSFAYGSYRSSSFGSDGEGWLVMPQGIYYFTNETQPGTNTSINRYIFDGSVGYHFPLFYVGLEFNYDVIATTSNGNPNSTDSYKSYGAQAGIMSGGWMLLGSYFFLGSGVQNGGTTTEVDYSTGTGFQILGGYLFDVGSGFSIGPEFLYRSLTYTARADGKSTGLNYTFSTMVPQIGVKYMF
jgi:hypothetical protein